MFGLTMFALHGITSADYDRLVPCYIKMDQCLSQGHMLSTLQENLNKWDDSNSMWSAQVQSPYSNSTSSISDNNAYSFLISFSNTNVSCKFNHALSFPTFIVSARKIYKQIARYK